MNEIVKIYHSKEEVIEDYKKTGLPMEIVADGSIDLMAYLIHYREYYPWMLNETISTLTIHWNIPEQSLAHYLHMSENEFEEMKKSQSEQYMKELIILLKLENALAKWKHIDRNFM